MALAKNWERMKVLGRMRGSASIEGVFSTCAEDADWATSSGRINGVPSLADAARRMFDIVFSATVLIVTSPILVVASLTLVIESGRPVLFRQRRMGRGGRPFTIYKLRGMYPDAPERYPELYAYDTFTTGTPFHQRHDCRVTAVGRVLRRFSIDELPNFVSVLKGDMSVVGPRPDIPELAHLYGDRLPLFLSVKPGVTSPAKAAGRDTLDFETTLAAELDYVRRRSATLDARTIATTAWRAICPRNVA
jgi:lipopolysaccharide/colanic/teichoic acid biosynthesis glycosyltransferase